MTLCVYKCVENQQQHTVFLSNIILYECTQTLIDLLKNTVDTWIGCVMLWAPDDNIEYCTAAVIVQMKKTRFFREGTPPLPIS